MDCRKNWQRVTGLLSVHVIGTTEGSVERSELRATFIHTCDGVSDDTVAPVRRAGVGMPIAYDTDMRAAKKAMLEAACATQGVR